MNKAVLPCFVTVLVVKVGIQVTKQEVLACPKSVSNGIYVYRNHDLSDRPICGFKGILRHVHIVDAAKYLSFGRNFL